MRAHAAIRRTISRRHLGRASRHLGAAGRKTGEVQGGGSLLQKFGEPLPAPPLGLRRNFLLGCGGDGG